MSWKTKKIVGNQVTLHHFYSTTITPGPSYEGCPPKESSGCFDSPYGCCPDGVHKAAGFNMEGCPGVVPGDQSGCEQTTFGCCPDGYTPMLDAEGAGCDTGIIEVRLDSRMKRNLHWQLKFCLANRKYKMSTFSMSRFKNLLFYELFKPIIETQRVLKLLNVILNIYNRLRTA